jgi:hypothetical protein
MVVVHVQPLYEQPSLPSVEVNLEGIVIHLDHPEYVVGIDVHVVVVNLLRQVGRSHRTGVQIKSNKGEGAPMEAAVYANELALTEAHVRLVRKRGSGARRSVRSGPAATDMRQTDEPVEVCDHRRVANVCQWDSRVQRVVVDRDSEGLEWYDAAGNWPEQGTSAPLIFVVLVAGIG